MKINSLSNEECPHPAVGAGCGVVAATGYGFAYVVARLAYDHGLNSFTLNFLRFFALALIVAAWIVCVHGSFRLPGRSLAVTLLMGLLIATAGITNFASIAYIPVSLAVLIFYTYPLVTLLLDSLVERRPPAPLDYLAFVFAFAGIALILEASVGQLNVTGVTLALAGSLAAGAHLVATQHAMRAAPFRVVTLYMSLSACALTALATPFLSRFSLPGSGPGVWLSTTVVAAFCVGMTALLAGVRLIGPVRTSIIMCMEPPVVIGFAYVLLGERLSALQLIGSALVIAGIVIVQSSPRRGAGGK